jgi:putative redox protein
MDPVRVTAKRKEGYAHALTVRDHGLTADEPQSAGGTDKGPNPQELLALSLASCTAITIEMYGDRKGWDLGAVSVEVDYTSDAPGRGRFDVLVEIPEQLSEDQLERLRVITAKCPVHRVLLGENEVTDRIEAG